MKAKVEIETIDVITTDEEFQDLAQKCADRIKGVTDFELDEEYYQSEARFNFDVELYDDLTIGLNGNVINTHDDAANIIKKSVGISDYCFIYNDEVLQICKFNGKSADDFIMLIENKAEKL
jgi:hypothetical protein